MCPVVFHMCGMACVQQHVAAGHGVPCQAAHGDNYCCSPAFPQVLNSGAIAGGIMILIFRVGAQQAPLEKAYRQTDVCLLGDGIDSQVGTEHKPPQLECMLNMLHSQGM